MHDISSRQRESEMDLGMRESHAECVQDMIDLQFCITVAWSVRLSHSCTMLKPMDGMRCHVAAWQGHSRGPK